MKYVKVISLCIATCFQCLEAKPGYGNDSREDGPFGIWRSSDTIQEPFFGGEGIIAENSRDEQRKAIKYNHLVANCLIFHNLCSLTRLVQTLEQRGEVVPKDVIAAISPYLTEHINRFGDYILSLAGKPPNPTTAILQKQTASAA